VKLSLQDIFGMLRPRKKEIQCSRCGEKLPADAKIPEGNDIKAKLLCASCTSKIVDEMIKEREER